MLMSSLLKTNPIIKKSREKKICNKEHQSSKLERCFSQKSISCEVGGGKKNTELSLGLGNSIQF
jgi:hypothetical protein